MNKVIELLEPLAKKSKLFDTEDRSDTQNTNTKIAGSPWWPKDIARPTDNCGRNMKFIGQINLNDIEEIELSDAIVCFHYSTANMHEGKMSFGMSDLENKDGYDVRVFTNVTQREPDNIISESCAYYLSDRVVKLAPAGSEEVTLELDERLTELVEEDELGELWDDAIEHYLENFEEGESHAGGWPQWWQDPEYPTNQNKQKYQFIAYLNGDLVEAVESFLFIDLSDKENPIAEFVCQTT